MALKQPQNQAGKHQRGPGQYTPHHATNRKPRKKKKEAKREYALGDTITKLTKKG